MLSNKLTISTILLGQHPSHALDHKIKAAAQARFAGIEELLQCSVQLDCRAPDDEFHPAPRANSAELASLLQTFLNSRPPVNVTRFDSDDPVKSRAVEVSFGLLPEGRDRISNINGNSNADIKTHSP